MLSNLVIDGSALITLKHASAQGKNVAPTLMTINVHICSTLGSLSAGCTRVLTRDGSQQLLDSHHAL